MNGEGSDSQVNPESDQRVQFSYGDGGVPLYVGIAWVVFILSYLAVMAAIALPDFIAWLST